VGAQYPFNFAGWTYDSVSPSVPAGYPQAILNQASSTQVINVTDTFGIKLCQIAASGTNSATVATFNGITLGGSTLTTINLLPAYSGEFLDTVIAAAHTPPCISCSAPVQV
jgi:hypothetical protein